MKNRRKQRESIRKAYLARIHKPDKYDIFAHSYLISKFVWAFVK